jgi:hypothetical protein
MKHTKREKEALAWLQTRWDWEVRVDELRRRETGAWWQVR